MNRSIKRIVTAAALACSAATALADYPIVSHRYLADPAVLVHDGRVYLYCSNDDENLGHESYMMQSLVCVSSSDLKNWTDHGVAFRVPENASWANRSWAPGVIARNDQFYLYFGNGGSGIGVATSDSPTGPFNDPIGGLLISHSTPGASGENMWLFDPFAFIDDDGQAYLYFGGNGESNGRVIKLNEDMISVDGAASSITAPGFFEAAWMHKRGDTYYFSYSTNPSHGMRIDYMTSDNPVSGFTYAGIVADQPPSNNNNNHHGIFEFNENWYHVYHNRFVSNQAGAPPVYLRNLGLEPLTHNEDGSIEQISYTRDGLEQTQTLDPYRRVEGETMAEQNGVETKPKSDAGMALASIDNGDWTRIRGVDFKDGANSFAISASSLANGAIELQLDGAEGTLIGRCEISNTSGDSAWTEFTCAIDPKVATGIHDLFLVFVGEAETELFELDWWQFQEAPPPLAAPDDVSASATSSTQIEISWATLSGADSYTLQRATELSGPYETIADNLDETGFTDTDLDTGLTYFYRVSAADALDSGPYSTPVSAAPASNFEEWIADEFPAETDPLVTAEHSDPDNDGLSNLMEYYSGSDPKTASASILAVVADDGSHVVVRLRRSNRLASIDGILQKSSDLANWIAAELPFSKAAEHPDHETLQARLQPDDGRTFLRISLNKLP